MRRSFGRFRLMALSLGSSWSGNAGPTASGRWLRRWSSGSGARRTGRLMRWRPLQPTAVWVLAGERSRAADTAHFVHVIARLKPDVGIEAASSDMAAVADGIARVSPANDGHGVAVEPLRETLIGREVRLTSMVLLG